MPEINPAQGNRTKSHRVFHLTPQLFTDENIERNFLE
jgi:hypothetical protein